MSITTKRPNNRDKNLNIFFVEFNFLLFSDSARNDFKYSPQNKYVETDIIKKTIKAISK